MAEDAKQEKLDRETVLRMDLEGRTAFRKPRQLVEPRPLPSDDRGRPVAMMEDAAPSQKARRQPFVLDEPKPE